MIKTLYIFLYTFIILIVCNSDVTKYSINKIYSFKAGNTKITLGYKPLLGAGIPNCPTNFIITKSTNNFFIADSINYSIKQFTKDFDFIKEIKGTISHSQSFHMVSIDNNNTIFYYDIERGLIKVNYEGGKIFLLDDNENLRMALYSNSYFVLDHYLCITNFTFIPNNFLIDEKGEIFEGNSANTLILKIINQQEYYSDKEYPFIDKNFHIALFNDKKILIYANRLLSADFAKHREYFHILNENIVNENKQTNQKLKLLSDYKKDPNENLVYKIVSFIGFDSRNYTYWNQSGNGIKIIVLSNWGNIIDIIDISEFSKNSSPATAIAPNGDIYFMKANRTDKTIDFYRINCVW